MRAFTRRLLKEYGRNSTIKNIMNTHPNLQEIMNSISKQKFSFSCYITNKKIFTHVAEIIKPFMLSMVQDNIKGQFFLSKTMLMPMIDSWQLRFHDDLIASNFIICNKRLFRLYLSLDKQLIVEENTEKLLNSRATISY